VTAKQAEAEELSKQLGGLREYSTDLHAECQDLMTRETKIVAIEIRWRCPTPCTLHPAP